MSNIIAIVAIAVIVGSTLAVDWVRRVALRHGLFDIPNNRSSHNTPVPRLGGLGVIPAVLFGLLILWDQTQLPIDARITFYGALFSLFIVSLWDDLKSLPSMVRLVVQTSAATSIICIFFRQGLVPQGGLEIAFLSAVLVVWVVGVTNIYNFMDGIDGLAGMQAVGAGFGCFVICKHFGAFAGSVLGLLIGCGALGFLRLNWSPARIFMGDSGSAVIGFCFAVMPVFITIETKDTVSIVESLCIVSLLLWPFLADGVTTLLRRLWKRENVLKPHRTHLYQRLVMAGYPHCIVVVLYSGLVVLGISSAWLVAVAGVLSYQTAFVANGLVFGLFWIFVCRKEIAVLNSNKA